MTMKKLLLGAIALGALALGTSAFAADLPVKAPMYKAPPVLPVAYSWTGCYIGAEGGGNWGSSRHSSATGGDETPTFDLSGGLAGGTLGCNYQVSNWVIGLEGDGSWTDKRGSAVDILPFNPAFTSQTHEKSIYTARGRIGLTWERALLYVTGGAAGANAGITVFSPGVTGTQDRTIWGWTFGGGVEWAFYQRWSFKVEYLFVDFGNPTFFTPAPPLLADRGGGIHLFDNIIRVGLNYRFGWDVPVVARY